MSQRFKNIMRGAEENLAFKNYLAYVENAANRQTKRMQGGNRDAQRVRAEKQGYILPFTIPVLGANAGYQVLYSQTAVTSFAGFDATLIGTKRLVTVAPADANYVEAPRGFKAARASVFVPSGAVEYKQSKITKLWYLHYAGKSHSLPFGATTAAEEAEAGALTVKNDLKKAGGNQQYFRVSISPEKYSV